MTQASDLWPFVLAVIGLLSGGLWTGYLVLHTYPSTLLDSRFENLAMTIVLRLQNSSYRHQPKRKTEK